MEKIALSKKALAEIQAALTNAGVLKPCAAALGGKAEAKDIADVNAVAIGALFTVRAPPAPISKEIRALASASKVLLAALAVERGVKEAFDNKESNITYAAQGQDVETAYAEFHKAWVKAGSPELGLAAQQICQTGKSGKLTKAQDVKVWQQAVAEYAARNARNEQAQEAA